MSRDVKAIERKWQERWQNEGVFKVDARSMKDKYYVLTMFPYPSGDRLHLGHWYQYSIMDSWARFQRMMGKNVFQPMGFDAFGLPAENFAIKKGIHPDISTSKNVAIMIEQFKRMGVSYDWQYMVNTSKPDYYKWTQWVFLQLYKKGLAYRSNAPVNWCPSCQTVLANEQVSEGSCERCDTSVVRKDLTQWFLKITDYSQRLLDNIDKLDWPSNTKGMQRNWIGRSEGAEITFKFDGAGAGDFKVFTTRPDTLFGVTYVVLAPEHPLVGEITTAAHRKEVEAYVEATRKVSEIDRMSTTKEKTGVFTGAYAINPVNGEKIPVWTADYVLRTYGTGAVMAVPAHDERDFAFAKKYKLPVRKVIVKEGTSADDSLKEAFTEVGKIINSGKYNGMMSDAMIPAVIKDLEHDGIGRGKVTFRLRDWLVSRQRYWGAPIPIVYCDKCGEVAVPEKDLPVRLPEDVEFKPTGESPLKRCASFIHAKCPTCGGAATREADTLDTFVCSSWYFLRYPSAGRDDVPFDKELTARMMPVDKYCGGKEHACMHLLYARFVNMALHDMGHVPTEEPFPSLFHQGLILGADGQKMSKSKGNAVSPDTYVDEYGADVMRLFLMFTFNYADAGPWDDKNFKAVGKFVERVWRLIEENTSAVRSAPAVCPEPKSAADRQLLFVFHNSLRMVVTDTDRLQFNTSIARFMELMNALGDYQRDAQGESMNKPLLAWVIKNFVVMLAPFAPHLAEEWWEMVGEAKCVARHLYPKVETRWLELDEIGMAVMVNGKLRDEIRVPADADEAKVAEIALASEKVRRHVESGTVVKRIFVPKKLINLIVK